MLQHRKFFSKKKKKQNERIKIFQELPPAQEYPKIKPLSINSKSYIREKAGFQPNVKTNKVVKNPKAGQTIPNFLTWEEWKIVKHKLIERNKNISKFIHALTKRITKKDIKKLQRKIQKLPTERQKLPKKAKLQKIKDFKVKSEQEKKEIQRQINELKHKKVENISKHRQELQKWVRITG